MLYQLLLTNKFPFKSKKMVCVGPSNSGKTSWVAPILKMMDMENVATVTREGKFSAHMLNAETELLFVDEWAPGNIELNYSNIAYRNKDSKFWKEGGYDCLFVSTILFDFFFKYCNIRTRT